MKKTCEMPTVEKIEFRYRDQVVAASGGGEGGNQSSNPTIGSMTSESWGQNGCKWYVAEAVGMGLCSYA